MTDPRVGVRSMNGIPIVELPDHRGFDTADELADAILAQINDGSLPPATKEQTARATAAAMMQQLYMRKFGGKVLALRDRFQDDTDSSQTRANTDEAARKLRSNTSSLDRPVIGSATSNGVSAAVNGQSQVLKGSSGEGDDWLAGSGFEELEQAVYRAFPDEGHPVRRLWRGLNEKLDN